MKYFLTIGGRKYDYLRMKFTREASMESKVAELLLAPAKGSTNPAFDEVVIITKEINNATPLLKWQGKVQQVQDIALPNGTIKVIAYDLKYKINFVNVLNAGYASSKGSTIFSAEIEPAKTDLTLGTVQTTDSILDTVSLGKSISGSDSKVTKSSAFEIIQIMGDSDIYIERNGTAHYLRDAGTDRSTTHILEHGLNGVLLPDIGYNEDEIRRVKQVIIKGAGVGSNFILGTAGTPSSTDKVKQIELGFVASNATATLAAQTVLNELDKTNKYAKFRLDVDLFSTNYDVFDTIKLKARLTNRTLTVNLKIFSIETTVSPGLDDLSESVTMELQNFERAQLAKMLNPIEVSSNSLARIKSGIKFTQVDNNTLPASLGEHSNTNIDETAIAGLSTLGTIGTFSSQKTNGAYVNVGVRCTARKSGSGSIRFNIYDGVDSWPKSNNLDYPITSDVGAETYITFTVFIPVNVAGKTMELRSVIGVGDEVEVKGQAYMFALGL